VCWDRSRDSGNGNHRRYRHRRYRWPVNYWRCGNRHWHRGRRLDHQRRGQLYRDRGEHSDRRYVDLRRQKRRKSWRKPGSVPRNREGQRRRVN
jgi:hypothetical protein